MPSSHSAAACLRYGALCALTSLSLFGSPFASAGTVDITGTPPTTATVGTAYSFQPTTIDTAGLTVNYTIYNKPSWANFDSTTGRLYGTPGASNVGTYGWVQIEASDGNSTSWLPAYTLTVSSTSTSSTGSGTTSSGTTSGGTTSGGTTTGTRLTISGTPPTTATVGSAYSFQPTATVPSGETATFMIYNKPSWATFDSTTGRLSGTPAASNVGTYGWVQIEISDAQSTGWLPAYTLTVNAASSSSTGGGTTTGGTTTGGTTTGGTTTGGTTTGGTTTGTSLSISGTPPTTATVGSAYSFQPTTTVPSGQTATFTLYNKPSWVTFDSTTGRLSGTPSASNVGTYRWVQIAASDGSTTAWLPAYTLTVAASSGSSGSTTSTGTVTVSWTPPTQNTDGSPLTNLAGYHIYYGTSQSNLNQVVNITNPGLATYVLSNLSAATWYFAMTSINSSGGESPRSAVVTYTVP